MIRKAIYGVGILLLFAPTLQAQDIKLRGLVSDRQTGRALEMANITLKMVEGDEVRGTTTDGNGLYEFSRLQPGDYIFMVRYVGYQTYSDTLSLERNEQNIVKHVRLLRSNERLREVTVSDISEDVEPGKLTISREDLRLAPTPAGSADLASYLQTQPGVVATGDRGGQLFIRGGTPSQNLILMDGMMIFQPFHIVGFFSVFPEDVISKVDLYAGGFGAEYSSRISSVIDVRLKNGNLYERNWSASVSPFISDLFIESPLKKGKSSLMVSLRGSLIEESSQYYLEEQQPLRFNSQLIKYSNIGGEGFNCSALFMRTYDRGKLDFEQGESFRWKNFVTGGRCAGTSRESSVTFTDIHLSLSSFSNEVGGTNSPLRSSGVFKSHLDVNLTQYIREDWRLDYGFFADYRKVDHDISELFLSVQKGGETFLSSGLFATLDIPLGNHFTVDPGASFTTYLGRFKTSLEPRLQFSWQPRGRADEEVHAAFGIYRQPLVGVTDYRDAGTAFTALMPMPAPDRRMEARHALLGWRQPVGRFLDFSVEGYYKLMRDIPVSVWSTVAQFTTDLAYADGSVYGVDVRLNFDSRNIYLGIGYGYSLTEYETAQEHFGTWFGEPVQRYHPSHDRRHQLNAQAGLEVGNFTANISWMYGSGLPFTRPMGFDSFFRFEDRPPDVRKEYGQPRVLLEKPYEGRFPDFHSLDISLEQAFELSAVRVRVQGGAVNAYDWQNLFYYDVFTQRRIDQLPLVPYLSLKMESL